MKTKVCQCGLFVKPNPFPQQFQEQCMFLKIVPLAFSHFLCVIQCPAIFRNPLFVCKEGMFIKFAINYQKIIPV